MIFLPFSKTLKFFFTIFLLFIFCSVSLYSQTIIKEKVIVNPEIKPSIKILYSTQSGAPVRVSVYMTSNQFCYINDCYTGTGTAHITPPGSTDDVVLVGSGEAAFNTGGTYYYFISWAGPRGQTACGQDATINVFVNDTLKIIRTAVDACSTWGQFTVNLPQPPPCGPECATSSPPEPPTFTVDVTYKNGDFGFDGCADVTHPTGYFYPLINDRFSNLTFEDFSIDVCYNNATQLLQASVNGNNIKIRAILDFCFNNLPPSSILIQNLDNVNKENIPPDKSCEAFTGFFYHSLYPVLGHGYYIKEFVEKHEQTHLEEFRDIALPKALNNISGFDQTAAKYESEFQSIGQPCLSNNDYDNFKNNSLNHIKELNDALRRRLNNLFKNSSSNENENKINDSPFMKQIIMKYQDKLLELYPELRNTSCYDYYIGNL